MGNTCVGPNISKNGFIQSVSAAIWSTRLPDEASVSSGKGEQTRELPVQNKPPEHVVIPKAEKKQEVKPKKMKRVSSAGLRTASVLQRKTGNLKDFYTLGKKLGQGQFGTTYLCIDKASGELLACKSIAKRKLLTDDDVEDVWMEGSFLISITLAEPPTVISDFKGASIGAAVAVRILLLTCVRVKHFMTVGWCPTMLRRNLEKTVMVQKPMVIIETEQGIFEPVALHGESGIFVLISWPTVLMVRKRSGHPWVQVDGVAPDKPLDSAVLSRLKQFSAMNKFKKMALRVIAESLSEEEIAGLKQMFEMIDADNSGHITFDELKAGLKRVGANLKESEIYDLMQAADVDNSGTIDYGEFVAATLHMNKIEKENHLFAAFSYFDKDGSGYITADELQHACEEFGIDVPLEELLQDVDQDNDGRIDYNEFVAMMQGPANAGAKKGLETSFSVKFREAIKF
ncbi:calcium-dependent protein kinase 1 [Tanacetum coccineum]